jgi:Domain of unknown function (DUF4149)
MGGLGEFAVEASERFVEAWGEWWFPVFAEAVGVALVFPFLAAVSGFAFSLWVGSEAWAWLVIVPLIFRRLPRGAEKVAANRVMQHALNVTAFACALVILVCHVLEHPDLLASLSRFGAAAKINWLYPWRSYRWLDREQKQFFVQLVGVLLALVKSAVVGPATLRAYETSVLRNKKHRTYTALYLFSVLMNAALVFVQLSHAFYRLVPQ